VENNGFVVMYASNFTGQKTAPFSRWEAMDDIGYTGRCMRVISSSPPSTDSSRMAILEYDFYTLDKGLAEALVFTLPTRPLDGNSGTRYAVAIDQLPFQIVDFTTVGRSELWKRHVLRNRAEKHIQLGNLAEGWHRLRIYAIDPGVILDEIRIDLGGLKDAYSALPETKMGPSKNEPIH
jgi:hypothetical protein